MNNHSVKIISEASRMMYSQQTPDDLILDLTEKIRQNHLKKNKPEEPTNYFPAIAKHKKSQISEVDERAQTFIVPEQKARYQ